MNSALIEENIRRIRAELAALAGGREVRLLAATKTRAADEIQTAFAAGIDAAGENRAQEFSEKFALGVYAGHDVQFIGHLQTNKVKLVVGNVSLIQSVDSVKLLRAVEARAAELHITQDILAEVNIGREPEKHGVLPEELSAFLDAASAFSNIRVLGLMTVAPKSDSVDSNRQYFAKMYKLFIDNSGEKRDNVVMKYLSMGMSGDYRAAVAEGSNIIRIGTGIFGPRQ